MGKNEKKMRRGTKKFALVLGAFGIMMSMMTVGAEAKTLAKSFGGDAIRSYSFAASGKLGCYDVYEYSTAYTNKYTENKEYYLRAYVGGTRDSAQGAVVDTGRVFFSKGDNSVRTDNYYYYRDVIGSGTAAKYAKSGHGKTCYAKYGYK